MFSSSRILRAATSHRAIDKEGTETMDTQKLLGELAGQLLSGGDRSGRPVGRARARHAADQAAAGLRRDTPKIEIHTISAYDKNGPFWAWNWLKLGEHSGTHFDAPIHWITGKDYADGATDTIPVQEFRRAGQRHRLLEGSGGRPRLPAHRRRHQGLGSQARRDQPRRVGGDAHRLVQAQRLARRSSSTPTRPARIRLDRRPRRSNI